MVKKPGDEMGEQKSSIGAGGVCSCEAACLWNDRGRKLCYTRCRLMPALKRAGCVFSAARRRVSAAAGSGCRVGLSDGSRLSLSDGGISVRRRKMAGGRASDRASAHRQGRQWAETLTVPEEANMVAALDLLLSSHALSLLAYNPTLISAAFVNARCTTYPASAFRLRTVRALSPCLLARMRADAAFHGCVAAQRTGASCSRPTRHTIFWTSGFPIRRKAWCRTTSSVAGRAGLAMEDGERFSSYGMLS